jgi:ribosomal protein L7/L12
MDRIGFARLLVFLNGLTRHNFDRHEIGEIDGLIAEGLKPATAPNAADVRLLLESMATDRKIEAIKAFRTLTGDGLKESKDAVERVMGNMSLNHARIA